MKNLKYNENDNYKSNQYSLLNKIIFSKYHFLQTESQINKIRVSRTTSFDDLHKINYYIKDMKILNTAILGYFAIEFLTFKKNIKSGNMKLLFIYPFIRITLALKLYYLYFINTYSI
jgi:hypothetical protein